METLNIFQCLGDLASRVSTYIDPIKFELEILNRKRFLLQNKNKHTNLQMPHNDKMQHNGKMQHIGLCKLEEDNEILFAYSLFKITEVGKRLKLPKRVIDPMRSSNLPKGKLVKIRRRAQIAVERLFAKPTR